MASENQGMNYEVSQENVAKNQETTDNPIPNLELNHSLKAKSICVRSKKEKGECTATVLPDPFLDAIKERHELAEIIAFNLLVNWQDHITWLCSITKDQNIWTFHISLWDLWCSSYDFYDYLKMMFLYFWALQFKRIQVKLAVIIETAVYQRFYFAGNHWYATTNEVDESEKQFVRKLFSGIPMVEIREDPKEVFGTRFAGNSLADQEPTEMITGKLLINSCEVHAMLDTCSTHSFITPTCTQYLNLTPEILDFDLSVKTLLGEIAVTFTIYKFCLVQINNFTLPVDLISLETHEFEN